MKNVKTSVKSYKPMLSTGLQSITFSAVRALGDFLHARMVYAGISTKVELARVSNLSRPTWDEAFKWQDLEWEDSQRETLETMAAALKFGEWHEVVEAWRRNDVRSGLKSEECSFVTVVLPRDTFLAIVSRAGKSEASAADVVGELLGMAPPKSKQPKGKGPPKPVTPQKG